MSSVTESERRHFVAVDVGVSYSVMVLGYEEDGIIHIMEVITAPSPSEETKVRNLAGTVVVRATSG